MGLLSLGTPLHWDDARNLADDVRRRGIVQFINCWNSRAPSRPNNAGDVLLWGDEVEYLVCLFDHSAKKVRLSTARTFDILTFFANEEAMALIPQKDLISGKRTQPPLALWRPEYGRFMLEGTPGAPYGGSLKDLLRVEPSMKMRRKVAAGMMAENESPVTFTAFPRMGCPDFLSPPGNVCGPVAKSLFVPDEVINPHVRFGTLTANIRRRRGSKVNIRLPLFIDRNTPRPFFDPTVLPSEEAKAEASDRVTLLPLPTSPGQGTTPLPPPAPEKDSIYMDAMAFGMGCCCLQMTFQAFDVGEARRLYDQLAVLAPIMLALTAAAPIWRGMLADVDCRWDVIAMSVDDRTEEERGFKPLNNSRRVIPKSRYDSISAYISTDTTLRPEYNDVPLVIDDGIVQMLRESGIDELLARHMGHLFIRDPLVIYKESLVQDDATSMDHFENIQSTNWQTVRFKPPPQNSSIGWRVEFRSMEIQLTDRENAAFAIFVVLVTRVILSFGLNLYIPLSSVDKNMKTAQKRGAVLDGKFWFRKDIFRCGGLDGPAASTTSPSTSPSLGSVEDEFELMTINEIINGKDDGFPGLIPLINSYLTTMNIDIETRCQLSQYLKLVKSRADGTLMTAASWIRKFVDTHPAYHHDSMVSEEVTYDLFCAVEKINSAELIVPELLGNQRV